MIGRPIIGPVSTFGDWIAPVVATVVVLVALAVWIVVRRFVAWELGHDTGPPSRGGWRATTAELARRGPPSQTA